MRTSDIAYVRNPARYYPPVSLEEMSLKEIVDKHIRTCAKANGQVSICSHCVSPCREGKRALELVSGDKQVETEVPLFDGKTMLELARQQNAERRAQMEVKEEKPKKIHWKNWYEEAKASGDAVKWVMENMGLPKAKALNKIYQYRYYMKTKGSAPVEQPMQEEPKPTFTFDDKLAALMKEQEEHQKEMLRYKELYEQEERLVASYKEKIDVLCKAMDIINGH